MGKENVLRHARTLYPSGGLFLTTSRRNSARTLRSVGEAPRPCTRGRGELSGQSPGDKESGVRWSQQWHQEGGGRELLQLAVPLILSSSFMTLQIAIDRILLS